MFSDKPFSELIFLPSTGHKDSVTCAVFSHDSSLVASGDMSGLIKVWKVETKEEIWSFEVGDLEVRFYFQGLRVLQYFTNINIEIHFSDADILRPGSKLNE